MRILLVDNYDSFTFNLYQLLAEISGALPIVVSNDALSHEDITQLRVDAIVVSPGPGNPEREQDFGVCRALLEKTDSPTLGVCLGHQGIASIAGGRVVRASEAVHGRISAIHHTGVELFAGLPQGFSAVRYHSLTVARPLPDTLEETAWTRDGVVMGLRHRLRPLWGVQFHPESIRTDHGASLLRNFINLADQRRSRAPIVASTFRKPEEAVQPGRTTRKDHRPTPLRVYFRRLAAFPDAEQTFLMLFGDDAAAFWLDSSQITSTPSRFSFMGGSAGGTIQYFSQDRRLLLRGNDQRIEFCESIFSFLNRWIAERPCQTAPLPFNFQGGFVGYFGYELKGECGASYAHRSTLPDCCLVYADRYLVFDHVERELYLVYIGDSESDAEAQTWFNDIEHKLSVPQMSSCGQSLVVREHVSFVSDLSRAQYLRSVGRCLDWIAQGETYEICLTTQLRGRTSVDPFEYYRTLRRLNPAPYSAFLKMYGFAVACSSPESFLNVQANRIVVSKPIKGTIRRSNDTTKDVEFRETLRNDMKSQSENLMIVDLIRNDLGRVCDVGSVSVPRLMGIESFATVHQMVSTISGVLRSDRSAVDCLRCSFPGGSMTGAPKIRTMNLIDELEPRSRGVYSGAIGYVSLDGAADLNIVIRTAVFQANDVSIGTGGAIVALSSASAELDELLLKSQPLLDAFAALTGRVSLKIE